jgi:hypothetical protein
MWAVARPPPTGRSLHSALSLEAVGVDGGIIANENGVVQRASAESGFLSESAEVVRWRRESRQKFCMCSRD